jgi:hypothetical protein
MTCSAEIQVHAFAKTEPSLTEQAVARLAASKPMQTATPRRRLRPPAGVPARLPCGIWMPVTPATWSVAAVGITMNAAMTLPNIAPLFVSARSSP